MAVGGTGGEMIVLSEDEGVGGMIVVCAALDCGGSGRGGGATTSSDFAGGIMGALMSSVFANSCTGSDSIGC